MKTHTLNAQANAADIAARIVAGSAKAPTGAQRELLAEQLRAASGTLAKFYRHQDAIRAALGREGGDLELP